MVEIVRKSTSTLIFTNTRSFAEIWYQKMLAQAPELSGQIYRQLLESRAAAGDRQAHEFGIEQNRRNLEAAIDCVYRQGMIPRRYAVEELSAHDPAAVFPDLTDTAAVIDVIVRR